MHELQQPTDEVDAATIKTFAPISFEATIGQTTIPILHYTKVCHTTPYHHTHQGVPQITFLKFYLGFLIYSVTR